MKNQSILFLFLIIVSCQTINHTEHLSDHPIKKPELFLPGIVSSEHLEFSMTISPTDAKTIFFTRRIGDGKQKIYETYYKNGQWSTPAITSFSTDRDETPHFSADGKTVYFGSAREIPGRPNKGQFDMNVWKTERTTNNTWTNPVPLSPKINEVQLEGEKWPLGNMSHLVTADGKTFYTGTMMRGEKGIDIYKTTLNDDEFTPLEKLPKEICNDEKWEYAPIISPDGNYLFTQVYNGVSGYGGDDIYVSKKDKNGNWLATQNLGSLINSNMNECPLSMTSDGKYFFFSQDEKEDPKDYDGIPSIYIIETESLQLEKLFNK